MDAFQWDHKEREFYFVAGVGWGAGLLTGQAALPARVLQLFLTFAHGNFAQVFGNRSFTKQFFSKGKFEYGKGYEFF